MRIYRISSAHRAADLSGTGAKLYGGRWNSIGNPVVYASENISLAMLEILVHAEQHFLEREYAVSCIHIPESLETLGINESLNPGWQSFPFQRSTVQLGDQWLAEKKTVLFKVPSAVNPHEHNFLINPLHSDFEKVEIEEILPLAFDLRLR